MGRQVRPGPLVALGVLVSLVFTSLAELPPDARPAEAAPSVVVEQPAGVEFGAPEPTAEDEPQVVRVTARERSRSAPEPPAVIPGTAMIAYEAAADAVSCGLHWSVLAAIGRVESNHGRFGGTRVLDDGTVRPAIRGIRLDGRAGIATIRDTDGGRLDGDLEYDRAIGPMQFIPSTWQRYAADGNGDGLADPDNIHDAALVAARYLCAGGADLRVPEQLSAAVFRYNRSQTYVDMVLRLADHYRRARLIAEPVTDEPPPPVPASVDTVGTPAPPPAPAPTPAPAPAPAPVETAPPPSTPPVCPSTTTTSETPEPLLPLPLVVAVLEELVGPVSVSTTASTAEPPADC